MALLKGTIKSALKLLLLVPLVLLVLWVNYFVDQTGLFRGDKFNLELAQILLEGDPVSNFEKMDEREVLKLYIKNMPEAYNTVVIGSSRGLQITAAIAGESGSFYNMGMSGEDFYDIASTISLLDKYDRMPQNMIIVLDPWILNDMPESYSSRSDSNLANSFLNQTLGFDVPYQEEDKTVYNEALLDLDYFQKNIAYYFEDHTGEERPSRVIGDVYLQKTETKMPDGTLLYTEEYRNMDQEWVDREALTRVNAGYALGMYDFYELNQMRCEQFEAIVDYVLDKGVSVIFVLSPIHPIYYEHLASSECARGVLLAEEFYGDVARQRGIAVFGSYDPEKANCTNADFYDGLHVRRESISKFFYGINASLV